MNDTRETLDRNLSAERIPTDNECWQDIPEHLRPAPRFKRGDRVVHATRPDSVYELGDPSRWDYEFQGWLVYPGLIGIHESNFVLEDEVDQWEPHPAGLWSWWTRRPER